MILSHAPLGRMRITGLISTALHGLLIAGLLLFARRGALLVEAPDKPVAVEMVMVEQKGSGATVVQAPTKPSPRPSQATPPPTDSAAPEKPTAETKPAPPPPPDGAAIVVVRPPPPPAPDRPNSPSPPMPLAQAAEPAPPSDVPRINLGGTDSWSNATTWGAQVIPATLDAKFHNRPPPFPELAARMGEFGTVVLLIHVTPDGLTAGADVLSSSGYPALDLAAEDAVMSWHFQPAVKDGLAVASEMAMQFNFVPGTGQ